MSNSFDGSYACVFDDFLKNAREKIIDDNSNIEKYLKKFENENNLKEKELIEQYIEMFDLESSENELERAISKNKSELKSKYLQKALKKNPNNKNEITESFDKFEKYLTNFKNSKDSGEIGPLLRDFVENIYKNHEINKNPLPFFEGAGGINWSMNCDTIRNHTTELFKTLCNKGLLLSKDEFNKKFKKDSELNHMIIYKNIIDSTKWIQMRDTKLTRVWGSQYVNSIATKNKLNVLAPKHLVIHENDISVKIDWSFDIRRIQNRGCDISCPPMYPIVSEINKGMILAEYIEGESLGNNVLIYEPKICSVIGYYDFDSTNRNIVKYKNSYWILDCEAFSFVQHHPELQYGKQQAYENTKPGGTLCEYNGLYHNYNKWDNLYMYANFLANNDKNIIKTGNSSMHHLQYINLDVKI